MGSIWFRQEWWYESDLLQHARRGRSLAPHPAKISNEGADLLKAVQQMKKGTKGRVYSEEQLLAISARKSANLTQRQFAELLNVSIDAVRAWEQGRRSPRGAAKTLLKIAKTHPDVLEGIAQI